MRFMFCLAAAAAVLAQPAAALNVPSIQGPQSYAGGAAPVAAPSAQEAFEARSAAFVQTMQAMATEMQTAAIQADRAKAKTDLDAIQARYQTEADGYATALEAFAASVAQGGGQGPTAEELASGVQQIRSVPTSVRADIEAAVSAQLAAPAAPQ